MERGYHTTLVPYFTPLVIEAAPGEGIHKLENVRVISVRRGKNTELVQIQYAVQRAERRRRPARTSRLIAFTRVLEAAGCV
ncbi:hypothetical protein EVAR_37775_1 [Eumeta japonica]|uniref:Uncharacterized protein n=1 Tax=Eumeta variegata TaxID=151549 RepID=A0A4C1WQL1_EUMVA|nr:hypothetical protein EVAR_37775_1 [Eumeta japonica]